MITFKQIDNFVFDEGSHTYELGGRLLAGVTTILNVRAKDFLKWWTVKMMYEFLLSKLEDVRGMNPEQWEALLMEGKKAHTVRSKQALDSEKVRAGLKEILLGPARLYELLRQGNT